MNGPDALMTNPLLRTWGTPHAMPPFAEIRSEHFAPAFEVAMREHRAELDAIAAQAEAPTFTTYFVYPSELRNSARVAAFRDFLLDKAETWSF